MSSQNKESDERENPLDELSVEEQQALKQLAEKRASESIGRRHFGKAAGLAALGLGSAGGYTAREAVGTASADASTSDADGDLGSPNDRWDVYGEGIDTISLDADKQSITAKDYASATAARPQTLVGGTPNNSHRSFGRLPTQWTDEGTIFSDADFTYHGWAQIVDAEALFANPSSKYYMYYSSYRVKDVRLAESDSLTSGWSKKSILFDTTLHGDLNTDIASPWPVYDHESGNMWIYAHSRDGSGDTNQFTFRASSSNGETNWSYDGQALSIPKNGTWDSHERAYLRCYRHGRGFIGIYQGRDDSPNHAQMGFAWSPNGDPGTWRTYQHPVFYGNHANYSPRGVGLEKGALINVSGQPFLLAIDGGDNTVKIGPWYGLHQRDHRSLEPTNLPAQTKEFGYHMTHSTSQKLYLIGPNSDNSAFKLWSKQWSDLL